MNATKYLFLGLAALLLTFTGCKSSQKVSSIPKVDENKSLLWKISGKDLSTPSYLYGTIHIIGDKDFFWPKGTEESFAEAKHLMLELDFGDPSLMMKVAMASMMKDTTMADLLNEEEYDRFKAFFKDSIKAKPMEMMAVERMKPMLGMGLAYPTMVNGTMVSYEEKFSEMAKEQKMEVSGLESVDDQISVINGIPIQDQVSMMMTMVDSFHFQKMIFDRMISLYKDQNLEDLVAMMSEYEEVSNVQAELLDDRNERWIPKIILQAKEEPTFVAVGAAHLFGKKGVIQLLRKEGYTVEPLSYQ